MSYAKVERLCRLCCMKRLSRHSLLAHGARNASKTDSSAALGVYLDRKMCMVIGKSALEHV
jgi:hypothetical protein